MQHHVKMKKQEKMSLKEFKDYCLKFDDNLTSNIPKDRFEIKCKKCDSTNVHVLFNGKQMCEGSECTGIYTSTSEELVFKCVECGNAIGVIKEL